MNVKELKFVEGEGVLVKRLKCNFRTLGKKYGKLMKDIAAQVATLTQEDIVKVERDLKENNVFVLGNIGDVEVKMEREDLEIINEDIPGWLVANEGNLTVALEVELTEALIQEGMARELINRVQNIRKESGFEITDRINITLESHDVMNKAVEAFGDYIKAQVLADSITIADNNGVESEFDEFNLHILVEKK